MPTNRHGKVRRLLKNGLAKVVNKIPFVIQLNYNAKEYKQEVSLGVDPGSKYIGLSATTNKKELYSAIVELRNDITAKLALRKAQRRSRRYRMRYRKIRFDNRKICENWIPPSIKNKVDVHLTSIINITKLLPISKIVIEVSSFDPNITFIDTNSSFWNNREYVLCRDHHTCQYCHGKSGDKILNVHHIESRKTGGNGHNNLITLCRSCHKQLHVGKIVLNNKRGPSLRDCDFMNKMKYYLYNELKNRYNNIELTFGYLTKQTRILHNLPKAHYIDAMCISGNVDIDILNYYYFQKKVRCQNRQIHKINILKGGRRKMNQAPFVVKGFRLFDLVEYDGDWYYIFARRSTGYFNIKRLDGTKSLTSVSYKKLKLINTRKGILTELCKK